MFLVCTTLRGVLNKVLYGEALPQGPTPYPLIYHFWQEREPLFVHLPLTNGAFFTYLDMFRALHTFQLL